MSNASGGPIARPPVPASVPSLQRANWSGALPLLLSLAPSSLSSPAPPRPLHIMASRGTYLHLALREEVRELARHAPAADGLAREGAGRSVEEPPDDDDGPAGEGDADGGAREDRGDEDQGDAARDAEPECWFEDEASGVPLRWHLFVGVLYDLMKGRALMTRSPETFLPWRIRVHFSAYPADLLPLDDGLDSTHGNGDDGPRVTALVRRSFRNSLKQALFLQHGSAQVAMALNKRSHEQLWGAVVHSNYAAYHEVNVRLQFGVTAPASGARASTPLAAAGGARRDAVPHLIPVRLLVDGRPARQTPVRHEKHDGEDRRSLTEALEGVGARRAPYATLGDVLADGLPDRFDIDVATGRTRAAAGARVDYRVGGLRPGLDCALVDLWRALSSPDHFLYVVAATGADAD